MIPSFYTPLYFLSISITDFVLPVRRFYSAVVFWVQWNATVTRGYLCRGKYDPQVSKTGKCSAFSIKAVVEEILDLVTSKHTSIKLLAVILALKICVTCRNNKFVINVSISGINKIGRNALSS